MYFPRSDVRLVGGGDSDIEGVVTNGLQSQSAETPIDRRRHRGVTSTEGCPPKWSGTIDDAITYDAAEETEDVEDCWRRGVVWRDVGIQPPELP